MKRIPPCSFVTKRDGGLFTWSCWKADRLLRGSRNLVLGRVGDLCDRVGGLGTPAMLSGFEFWDSVEGAATL